METILLIMLTLRDGSKTFLELPTETKEECLFVDTLIRKDGFVATEGNKIYFSNIVSRCEPLEKVHSIGSK